MLSTKAQERSATRGLGRSHQSVELLDSYSTGRECPSHAWLPKLLRTCVLTKAFPRFQADE